MKNNRNQDVIGRRLRELKEIETACIRARVGGSYAASTASTPTILAVAVCGLAMYLGYRYVPHWPLSPVGGWLVTMVVSVIVFVAVYRKLPIKTHRAKIYSLLTRYEPVEKTEYARLQAKAKADDLLLDDIRMWIMVERAAVVPSVHQSEAEQARVRFANAGKEPGGVVDFRGKRS